MIHVYSRIFFDSTLMKQLNRTKGDEDKPGGEKEEDLDGFAERKAAYKVEGTHDGHNGEVEQKRNMCIERGTKLFRICYIVLQAETGGTQRKRGQGRFNFPSFPRKLIKAKYKQERTI